MNAKSVGAHRVVYNILLITIPICLAQGLVYQHLVLRRLEGLFLLPLGNLHLLLSHS
jgi:hypothetical protein